VVLREIILCRSALGAVQGSVQYFVTRHVSPPVLVGALEDLVQERLLPPSEARQIEEAILQKTHRSGVWL
jgi:hypothetical protein